MGDGTGTGSKQPNGRYTIAVDFDGVIHSYTSAWIDHHVIPDPPIPGAIEWLNEIEDYFDVVIFTTRGKTSDGQMAVRAWLSEYGCLWGYRAVVTDEKPPALIYLDDRAVRFEGTYPTKTEIHRARPYRVES